MAYYDSQVACPNNCGQTMTPAVADAYQELYGGYSVKLLELVAAIEKNLAREAEYNAARVAIGWTTPITVEDMVGEAVETWLGHSFEDMASAARHRQQEGE